jgi:hypothetical protein
MEDESMKIKEFWVVTKPTEISGMDDICFKSTPQQIGLQFLGGLTCGDVVSFYSDESEASLKAMELLDARCVKHD